MSKNYDMVQYLPSGFEDRFCIYYDLLAVSMLLKQYLRYTLFEAPEIQAFKDEMLSSLNGIILCCAKVVCSNNALETRITELERERERENGAIIANTTLLFVLRSLKFRQVWHV